MFIGAARSADFSIKRRLIDCWSSSLSFKLLSSSNEFDIFKRKRYHKIIFFYHIIFENIRISAGTINRAIVFVENVMVINNSKKT